MNRKVSSQSQDSESLWLLLSGRRLIWYNGVEFIPLHFSIYCITCFMLWTSFWSSSAIGALPEPPLTVLAVVTGLGDSALSDATGVAWVIQSGAESSNFATTSSTRGVSGGGVPTFVLAIPFETRTVVSGGTVERLLGSPNRFEVSSTRGDVIIRPMVDGQPARILFVDGVQQPPDTTSVTIVGYSNSSQGRLIRLTVSAVTRAFSDWSNAKFGASAATKGNPENDPDGDGLSNRQEYLAGTEPLDPKSSFAVREVSAAPSGTLTIRWESVVGRRYKLQRSNDLSSATAWTELPGTYEGIGGTLTAIDSPPLTSAYHFYRLVIVP
jgi:hypothetical protein